MNTLRYAVSAIVLAALLVSGAFAQATTATLRGKVIDTDGSGLPGVPVTVNSRSHGDAKKTVMTDIEGSYKFQLLPPANDYTLSVSYPGFAPIEVGPIDLDPGKTTIQDITLRSQEELTQRVEVVAHGSIVDTESTKTETTFNTEFIEGLPIIGRSYQDVLTLTPGVTDTDGDGNPNVQGARQTGLQYRLDGGNITDPASGTFGQNLNYDAIEEIEVITAGASAEYGRADGGFANVITRSGSNDFEGSFKMFWQGAFLNGDGATENQDTFLTSARTKSDLRRISPYGTIGGAFVKDKFWGFLSLQYLDRTNPLNLAGATITTTIQAWYTFAKLTWQANSDNKLALQYNSDPYEATGFFLDFGTEQDSDALWKQGGTTPQLRWTSIVSPTLLLETLLTHYLSGISITPVSDLFHTTDITQRVVRTGNTATIQAAYPVRECSTDGTSQGFITNCDPAQGDPSIYQINVITGTTTGPFWIKSDDTRTRNALKTDISYTLEDAWGEHQIKSGIEFADEKFSDTPINNAFFVNAYEPCPSCRDPQGNPLPNAVTGVQNLTVPTPTIVDQRAVSFNSAAYLVDTWKPKQNITIQASVRIDREDIDTSGFKFFDPRVEKRKFNSTIEALCVDAARVAGTSGLSNWGAACDPSRGFLPGYPPVTNLIYTMDADTPEHLRRYDVDENGEFNSGVDGEAWNSYFTTYLDRQPENFEITNLNLSPRLSVSWDPWADGKTKIFSTWGRYYDRLFLDTVRNEIGPDTVNYTFEPDPVTYEFEPGMLSRSASAVSVQQVDRNLRTPYTDSFTVGFERELAPEWSTRITYTQKLGWDLLQDTDYNHVLCTQQDVVFGLDPSTICPSYTDNTGKVHLSDDIFGDTSQRGPNNAPDLYNVNPNFNQILRIGNFNASKYRSVAFEVNKRLHRNWQMQASYTWSRATGQAEDFGSTLGNDPSTADDEKGYLSYDQRHRVVLIANTQLPKEVELGGTVTWEGGTPYSVTAQVLDEDDVGNVSFRTFYPTHQRNDQRNGNYWGIDAQVVKRFVIGRVQASAQVAAQNLLNMDDLTLSAYRSSSLSGVQLQQGPQGLRRFGRSWELALTFNF